MKTPEETKTLMDGLFEEMNRCRELLQQYRMIGPAGVFGSYILQREIELAELAIRENDIVKMVQAYQLLKEAK